MTAIEEDWLYMKRAMKGQDQRVMTAGQSMAESGEAGEALEQRRSRIVPHLEAALDVCDDERANFHIREALQHLHCD